MPSRAARGFTLIDVAVTLAVAGVLASVALPSYQTQLAKARRSEAIQALNQMQLVQERFRANHGSYALRIETLHGVAPRGDHYELALVAGHADGYIARARMHPASGHEGGCAELTLGVIDGVASQGPTESCWNR
jgi:type IV pilus assembly protein PilE